MLEYQAIKDITLQYVDALFSNIDTYVTWNRKQITIEAQNLVLPARKG